MDTLCKVKLQTRSAVTSSRVHARKGLSFRACMHRPAAHAFSSLPGAHAESIGALMTRIGFGVY